MGTVSGPAGCLDIKYMVILVWNFGLQKMTPNSAKQKPFVLLWRPLPINKQICFRHVDPMWKPTLSYQYHGVAAEMLHENPKIQSLTLKKA